MTETLRWAATISSLSPRHRTPQTPTPTTNTAPLEHQYRAAGLHEPGSPSCQMRYSRMMGTRWTEQRPLHELVLDQVDGSVKHLNGTRARERLRLLRERRLLHLGAVAPEEAHTSQGRSRWTMTRWTLTSLPSRLAQLPGPDLGGVLQDPGRRTRMEHRPKINRPHRKTIMMDLTILLPCKYNKTSKTTRTHLRQLR